MRFKPLPLAVGFVLGAVLCGSLASQSIDHQAPAPEIKGRVVPAPVDPQPFLIDGSHRKPSYSIEFRAADQMTERDRLLVADAESSIAEHAGFAGFELGQPNWGYQQVVCPALPNHLFLQYTRNNGDGDVTVFSASIPRNGEGRVRIVPVLKRGNSLFSPAPSNTLTISAFNQIRAEEGEAGNSDWLGNGLCYAALAGAHPRILPPGSEPSLDKPIPALTAVMEVQRVSPYEQVIRFADAAATPRPMQWTMTFSRKGRLIKATHSPAAMETVRPVPQDQELPQKQN